MSLRNLEDTDIECPHCGAIAPAEATRCPKCGQSFYPEDDPRPSDVENTRTGSAGLLRRMITLMVIGGMMGGGLSMWLGASWVWLILAGALVFGALGWFWERQG